MQKVSSEIVVLVLDFYLINIFGERNNLFKKAYKSSDNKNVSFTAQKLIFQSNVMATITNSVGIPIRQDWHKSRYGNIICNAREIIRQVNFPDYFFAKICS